MLPISMSHWSMACASLALSTQLLLFLLSLAPVHSAHNAVPAAAPTLVYALCNASLPSQTGFSLISQTLQHSDSCVTFVAAQGYNAALSLLPCLAGSPAQAWVYDAAAQSLRNPAASCGGLGGACIELSGQEFGACTSSPPALGAGCIVGAWPSPASPQTSWNDRFAPNVPAQGMLSAVATSGSGGGGGGGGVLCVAVQPAPPPAPQPLPTADVLAWSRKEVMCLYDIDICTYAGSQGCSCSAAPPPVDAWAPSALDTDSWIAAGESAGCAIHILVAKQCVFFARRGAPF